MRTFIRFVTRIHIIIYLLCGIGVFFAIRTLVVSRRAGRLAVYPMEHEAARNLRARAVSTIVSLIAVLGGTYVLVNIVEPNLGNAPDEPTPTPVVFLTPEPTSTPYRLLFSTVTPTIGLLPGDQPVATGAEGLRGADCIRGALITSPAEGEMVSGQVDVEGEANILNFAQYRFEVRGPATDGTWAVVGNFNRAVVSGYLGAWDSTSLLPGEYTLRLVVFDAEGNFVTPCEVGIVIQSPLGAPPTPTETPTPEGAT
jgi:hypothetical protein